MALGFSDGDDYRRAADLLDRAGYRCDTIHSALGADENRFSRLENRSMFLARTAQPTPLNTLIRLFTLNAAAERRAVEQALAPMELATWTRAGLLAVDGANVLARVRLRPWSELWLAHDLPLQVSGSLQRDYVMGIGASTVTLARLAVRRPAMHALDLGCGCGSIALSLAAGARRVVASDYNRRALDFTRFNARLNGIDRLTTVGGDLFEPLGEQRFDLIACNAPFVVSPQTAFVFRDGGLPADGFVRRLASEAPARLNEQGFCVICGGWAHFYGEDWRQRLATWFEDSACDVWVASTQTADVAEYATVWIDQSEPQALDHRERLHAEWLAYYRRERIERISDGVIVMRKSERSGRRNWLRIDEGLPDLYGDCGADVQALFRAQEVLERAGEEDLLEFRPRLSSALRLRQQAKPGDPGWRNENTWLTRVSGIGYDSEVPSWVANLLAHCDGRHSVRQLIDAVARPNGRPADELTEPVLAVVRQLLAHLMLV